MNLRDCSFSSVSLIRSLRDDSALACACIHASSNASSAACRTANTPLPDLVLIDAPLPFAFTVAREFSLEFGGALFFKWIKELLFTRMKRACHHVDLRKCCKNYKR